MKLVRLGLVVCGLIVLLGCSGPEDDWGNDHLVLDELQLLDESDLWVELFSFPTQQAPCNVAICTNTLGSATYEITGNVDEAWAKAMEYLLQTWVLTSGGDPFELTLADFQLSEGVFVLPSVDFQLRKEVPIATTTDTAFLSVRLVDEVQDGPDRRTVNAIAFTFTSDIDPNWTNDEILNVDNIAPFWIASALVFLCLFAAILALLGKSRLTPPSATMPTP